MKKSRLCSARLMIMITMVKTMMTKVSRTPFQMPNIPVYELKANEDLNR